MNNISLLIVVVFIVLFASVWTNRQNLSQTNSYTTKDIYVNTPIPKTPTNDVEFCLNKYVLEVKKSMIKIEEHQKVLKDNKGYKYNLNKKIKSFCEHSSGTLQDTSACLQILY